MRKGYSNTLCKKTPSNQFTRSYILHTLLIASSNVLCDMPKRAYEPLLFLRDAHGRPFQVISYLPGLYSENILSFRYHQRRYSPYQIVCRNWARGADHYIH